MHSDSNPKGDVSKLERDVLTEADARAMLDGHAIQRNPRVLPLPLSHKPSIVLMPFPGLDKLRYTCKCT